jgi:hypothetical protein
LQPEGEPDGATVLQPEGEYEGESDGVVMVDPFSSHPQVFSEHLEPVVQQSKRIRKPTSRLIEDSLFHCTALTHNHFQ